MSTIPAGMFAPIVPAGLFDKYYEMDPRTDDLIPHAAFLRKGMIVLLENASHRADVTDVSKLSPADQERARKLNRWARVTHIHMDEENEKVHFVAEYSDGIKKKRVHGKEYAWIVRRDSFGWQQDVTEISMECRMAPSTVSNLLETGWAYVSDPDGDNPNFRAWTKNLKPTVSEQRQERDARREAVRKENEKLAAELKGGGMSASAIAHHLGLTEADVRGLLKPTQDPEN